MRIYLVGAHSTGKTTLCRYISLKYNLPMITEAARSVLSEMEVPLENLRTDIGMVDDFQAEVISRQIAVEKDKGGCFVSDRAFDCLAYAAEHSNLLHYNDVWNMKQVQEYIEWVKEGIVFFIRPHKELLMEDGVRETPVWESVVRIDGMVKFLLESTGTPYMPVSCLSMQERIRTVDFVLNKENIHVQAEK